MARLPASMGSRRQGRAARAAAVKLDYVAVCMIGYSERVPRYMGDNLGVWPIRFATTKKPREIWKKTDLEQPLHKVSVLEMVWTESDRHAKRLKDALDLLLLGSSEDAQLRHGWRNVDNPETAWIELLNQALILVNGRETVNVFGQKEWDRRHQRAQKGGRTL
jgi:hypothetical protein